ncbi:MAG: peptidase [Ignavibacteriales bacterium CG18_big_fil_WC_8_21_14_2_50_31_20]|nr:MAG: peptidase [Ignavibacteriales bacterium CG18_big_fil_WC_8_21_14_2_50_31_20]
MAYLKPSKRTKLSHEELKHFFNQKLADSKYDKEEEAAPSIIGQERALKALKLGVELRKPGYNIFITGLSGTGKTSTVKKLLKPLQPVCIAMFDYAYVYNFEDGDRPKLLKFKAGEARKFKKDMLRTILFVKDNISRALEAEPFASNKIKIFAKFNSDKNELLKPFEEKLLKNNLTIGKVKEGEAFRFEILAVINDKVYSPLALNDLIKEKVITQKKAEKIVKNYQEFQNEFNSIFKEIYKLNNKLQDDVEKLEQETSKNIIQLALGELKSKYSVAGISKYLKMVENDIINNLAYFKKGQVEVGKQEVELEYDYLRNYEVNIILDNSKQKGCPVIIETSPTYQNLFGAIEKYSDGEGGWFTDFTGIKAGSLLRANGGYLILNAADTYQEPGVWKTLKRVLYYGILEIQDKYNANQAPQSIMQPEPIKIDTKIILIGSSYIYSVLSAYEDDFNKIFKIKAEFDSEMKRTDIGVAKYIRVIKKLIDEEKLKEFSSGAITKILEYSARFVDSKNKLTTRFSYILDIAREADFWASDVKSKIVNDYHVVQAYTSARERHGLYESKVNEMFDDGTMMIDTSGFRIGQINGLAVYGGDKYSFGKPTRITATVAIGNGTIVNVEREAGLSGSTHNKGVLVITGYLKEKFGKNIPISFNASLVFEQGYGMIDGDSASITEIVALLSALTEIPIKQSYAITGSVNQKGDIQPIGGVNDKIEGFYDLCKTRGLTGKEGVIIPIQNVNDLMLKDEIITSVKEQKFSIYAISQVEDALELLMGVKAGKELVDGHYQANTIFGEVERRLKEMRKKAAPLKQPQAVEPIRKKNAKKIV